MNAIRVFFRMNYIETNFNSIKINSTQMGGFTRLILICYLCRPVKLAIIFIALYLNQG